MTQYPRYFNTSGPNIPSEHYTLMRERLVEQGLESVRRSRYFTIWAPRQTGKSTYFLLLKTALERDGYAVAHFNAENYLDATKRDLVRIVSEEVGHALKQTLVAASFTTLERQIKRIEGAKLVLIIDEIEGLNPKIFGQFLHTIRNLYHSRQQHCLKSVILVGVSNIVGVVEDNASPFNIADNLPIPFFTVEETCALLEQHEQETGQRFDEGVKEKIAETTASQPGLVNGFAAELVRRFECKPVITLDDYVEVEDWFLNAAIDKNIQNIINKGKQHRAFLERLLFSEQKIHFDIDRPEVKALYTNGIIDRDPAGNVSFKVPLYRKRLHKSFYPYTNGERGRLSTELKVSDYFLPDGSLNFEKWIGNYKAWVQRRSFKYFREKDAKGQYLSLKEAALVYSFETYVAAFLDEAGGKSYLEPHVGLGRSDLIIKLRQREYVVEFKVYSGESNFGKGKVQLAYYCKKLGLTRGEYLIFVPKHLSLPDTVSETSVDLEGVSVRTWLVFYDEKKDF
jgi:AAA domain